jgi:hypothetical protein
MRVKGMTILPMCRTLMMHQTVVIPIKTAAIMI